MIYIPSLPSSSNIVKIAISTLFNQLISLSQSLFVRRLKVACISTTLKVLVELAEGETRFIHAIPNIDIGSAASLQSSHLKPTDERTGAAHPVHM